jgi:FixJ family two-component response regulator
MFQPMTQRNAGVPEVSHRRIITIIDDDESVRQALSGLLRSLGFANFSFASAEEFLQSPSLHNSDCIIADVHMPGMSGLELQEVVRRQAISVPIIFITAFPRQHIRERADAAGAVAVLEKPFDAQLIVDSLDSAFGRRDLSA